MTEQPDHLGGFRAAGDPATWYPDMWGWFVSTYEIQSVIDVGCGPGLALDYFAGRSCRTLGVEGTPQDKPNIIQHDYSTGPLKLNQKFDLAWCCEFVEHVEEQYIDNFLATFQSAKFVLMTHADIGQPGHHHVNCRPSGYWIEKLEAAGFLFDAGLTITTRKFAFANEYSWIDGPQSETWWGFHVNHYVRSGLAFRSTR